MYLEILIIELFDILRSVEHIRRFFDFTSPSRGAAPPPPPPQKFEKTYNKLVFELNYARQIDIKFL